MYDLNIFALLCLIGIIVYTKYLSNRPLTYQNSHLKFILFLVLIINIVRIILEPMNNIPVEFSRISYFVVAFTILLNLKFLKIWATYASLMSGFFYYLTMILTGGNIYSLTAPIEVFYALFCHGSLLIYGLLQIRGLTLNRNYRFQLFIGLIIVALWAELIRSQIIIQNRIFIYEIMDAKLIYNNFNFVLWLPLLLYYFGLIIILILSTNWFFKINHLMNTSISKKYVDKNINLNKKATNK